MWLVANEMESPFGTEANSLDLRLYHNEFVMRLRDLFHFNAADTWIVASGNWVPPPENGTIGSFNSTHAARAAEPDPLSQAVDHDKWRRESATSAGDKYRMDDDYGRPPTPRIASANSQCSSEKPKYLEKSSSNKSVSLSPSLDSTSASNGMATSDNAGTLKPALSRGGSRGRNDSLFQYAQEEETKTQANGDRERPPPSRRTGAGGSRRRLCPVPDGDGAESIDAASSAATAATPDANQASRRTARKRRQRMASGGGEDVPGVEGSAEPQAAESPPLTAAAELTDDRLAA